MSDTKYPLAEKFKSIQGEGVHTGVQMAFLRFVGCSVGKKTCTHCDTDFDKTYPQLGGGLFTIPDILAWVGGVQHICLTGGEPLDRDLSPLIYAGVGLGKKFHIETSGTRCPKWLLTLRSELDTDDLWVTVSPKPGYLQDMVKYADEIKVILGGLGEGSAIQANGWPSVAEAVAWARLGHVVYLQPRNHQHSVDDMAMQEAIDIVSENPELRLSVQLHKFLFVR